MNEFETVQRALTEAINSKPGTREELLAAYKGKVWDTKELQEEFKVIAFSAPFCAVKRKSDGVEGVVGFQHMPRFYFGFLEDTEEQMADRAAGPKNPVAED